MFLNRKVNLNPSFNFRDNSVIDRKDKSSSVQTAANQLSDSGDKKENINTRTKRDASGK